MGLDIFLKGNLAAYYVLIIALVGLFYLFNKKKSQRKKQFCVAIFLAIATFAMSVGLLLSYSLNGSSSVFDSFSLVMLIKYLTDPESEVFEVLVGFLVFISIIIKFVCFLDKTQDSYTSAQPSNTTYSNQSYQNRSYQNSTYNRTSYSSPTYNNSLYNSATPYVPKPGKVETFFYVDEKGPERRGIFRKIFLVVAYSLMTLYIVGPLFSNFGIDFTYSTIGLLLYIITSLEWYYIMNWDKQDNNKKNPEQPAVRSADSVMVLLNKLLKLEVVENLVYNQKMVNNSNGTVLKDSSALVCEVTNSNDIREINLKIMNSAFFENKKVLVVSLNQERAERYQARLAEYNKV